MIYLNSKYGTAAVYAETVEQEAISQILNMANSPLGEFAHIRIMPDCHAGKGCTIGTTMRITDKVCPNLVGVDIGCGMYVCSLEMTEKIENNFPHFLESLDRTICDNIPSGMDVNKKICREAKNFEKKLDSLFCRSIINTNYALRSVGSLGGGNHFIELDKNKSGSCFLVVHSGSRHLGKEAALFYQSQAEKYLKSTCGKRKALIEEYKAAGRENEIEQALNNLKPAFFQKELAYCEGRLFDEYVHDMKIIQEYAALNRKMIASMISSCWAGTEETRPVFKEQFTTVHNYIDTENMILRKGAVSAQEGEIFLIPLNMRDGSLLCRGKGNPEWNYSAPHGAGRLMSRSKAKENISLDEFVESMKGIYTSSAAQSTIDESPMAYKSSSEIIRCIEDTAEVIDVLKPVYNFKAH